LKANFPEPLQYGGIIAIALTAGFGVTLVTAIYSAKFDLLNKVVGLTGRFLLFLSAPFFTVSSLPTSAQAVIAWNPIAHLVEYARDFGLGVKPFVGISIAYPSLLALEIVRLDFMVY